MPDLCEMAVVANATGMMPDRPLFHAPVARIDEMPDLFCPKADGGLFDAPGRLDIFNCFRRPDEASMAGGVFIVVECKDKKIVAGAQGQGAPVQPQRPLRRAVPIRPPARRGNGHQRPRGGPHEARHRRRLRPLCDLCGRAVRDLPKGTVLDMGGHHHTIDGVEGVLNPAAAIGPDAALPFYLLSHRTLCRDVPAGNRSPSAISTCPKNPTLLRLRRRTGQGVRPREVSGGQSAFRGQAACPPFPKRQTGSPLAGAILSVLQKAPHGKGGPQWLWARTAPPETNRNARRLRTVPGFPQSADRRGHPERERRQTPSSCSTPALFRLTMNRGGGLRMARRGFLFLRIARAPFQSKGKCLYLFKFKET